MVVITIMWIMVMTVAIPYIFYQNKAKVRVTRKEISQLLYEGRNMAINGFSSWWVNQSIGILFDTETGKNSVSFIVLPYSASGSDIIPSNFQTIKTVSLEPWMQIDNVGGEKKVLFFYSAVFWVGSYYSWNDAWVRQELTGSELPITFSYKWAWTWSLQWSITYFPQTYIVDY